MKIKNKINYKKLIRDSFSNHISTINDTFFETEKKVDKASEIISKSLKSGGTIFWCGNGGSAADSQHIAAEFVGRYKKDRRPLKSIALTTDTSIITCISNDYSMKTFSTISSSGSKAMFNSYLYFWGE